MAEITSFEFLQKIGSSNVGFTNQHIFVFELLESVDSSFIENAYVNKGKTKEDSYPYLKKLYKSKTFSPRIKESIPKPVYVEGLASFFNDIIGDESLIEIMANFGVVNKTPKKELFIKALCMQFERIATSPLKAKSVEDIVENEYRKFVEAENIIIVESMTLIEQENLISDLKNLRDLFPLLNELLLLLDNDFMVSYPTIIFIKIAEAVEKISTIRFFNQYVITAKTEFNHQQDFFTGYLFNNKEKTHNPHFNKVKCAKPNIENFKNIPAAILNEFECNTTCYKKPISTQLIEYNFNEVKKETEKRRNEFYLSIEKFIKIEKDLADTAKFLCRPEEIPT